MKERDSWDDIIDEIENEDIDTILSPSNDFGLEDLNEGFNLETQNYSKDDDNKN